MKRSRLTILLMGLLIWSLFYTPFSVEPASGVQINYTEYWFYISEPTVLNFSKMYFQIRNTGDFPVRINCTVEKVEGMNLSIDLSWDSDIFQPDESMVNRYEITVNEIFNHTYPLRIFCTVYSLSGSNVGTGAVVLNLLTYYSELEGYLLEVETLDQSGEPRICQITMMYKKNATMNWSPIKELNGTRYKGYLPRGLYHIVATDTETHIFGQIIFELWKDTNEIIELELVGFNEFRFVEHNETGQLGVNCTINNFVGTLEEITIFANIYENGTYLTKTAIEYRSEFPKTSNYELTLWFPPIVWKNNTNYKVQGVIYSYEILIAQENREFDIFFPATASEPEKPTSPISLEVVVGLIGLGSILVGVYGYNSYRIRKIKRELSKVDE